MHFDVHRRLLLNTGNPELCILETVFRGFCSVVLEKELNWFIICQNCCFSSEQLFERVGGRVSLFNQFSIYKLFSPVIWGKYGLEGYFPKSSLSLSWWLFVCQGLASSIASHHKMQIQQVQLENKQNKKTPTALQGFNNKQQNIQFPRVSKFGFSDQATADPSPRTNA